ncbi:MAG: hypothetical protein J5769_02885 [Bacteroidales bacterium]|nr:hypothetical protein [Bacteroidales bacterium]
MPYKIKETECTCLQCGGEITYGRFDRKFCSDKCRNKYHNSRRGKVRRYRWKIMNTLERNHDILERLLDLGLHSIGKLELADLGYDCSVVTSFCRKSRTMECRCYDIRYIDHSGKLTDIGYIPALPEKDNSQ